MITNEINPEPTRSKKIIIWLCSIVISGFFILSALGWFAAVEMASAGNLGKEATEFYKSLNQTDKIIRTSQVICTTLGCIMLMFSRQLATKIFLTVLIVSIASYLFIPKWGITFLTPLTVVIAFGYSYLIGRKGFLHP